MAELLAVVAAARSTSTANAEGRAISLDVAESLAVIALLRFRGTRERALARLVVWTAAWSVMSNGKSGC